MIVLTDVDDVLLAWVRGFMKYMKSKGYHLPNGKKRIYIYSLSEAYQIKEEKILELIHDFNESEEFGNLKPISRSVDSIKRMNDKGIKFVAITQCSNRIESIRLRKENLLNSFGDVFQEIICLPMKSCKSDYLKLYTPTIWIEDKPANAIIGYDLGHYPILLRRDHNHGFYDSRVTIANNWTDIENYVYNFFKLS